jgi:type IV pilus assembly protein PilA
VTRAKWQENIVTMEPVKLAIANCVQENAGSLTNCTSAANLGLTAFPTPKYGSQLTVSDAGAISTTGTAEVGSLTLTLTPTIGESTITWVASGTCTKQKCGIKMGT